MLVKRLEALEYSHYAGLTDDFKWLFIDELGLFDAIAVELAREGSKMTESRLVLTSIRV